MKYNTIKIIRIIIYIIIIISMLMLKYTDLIQWTCFINDRFGILCPTCGLTRAVKAILNFNFNVAIEKNAYVTLVLFPVFVILFVDDLICMIFRKKSFVDIILGE